MSYQVIARRWRPQTFNQLIAQEHISLTLENSLKSGRLSHAYIFTGPRGVGKTTTARILAKSLNCVNGPTPDPCGVCENCVEIKNGNSFDVIEIDGASNNGVDNIRELRETVHFAPVKSNYKIYIIDEVHMLSTGAFNALLKTLEEPPDHAVFIFATTEIHKVPETILSRCQKYFFKTIAPDAIVNHLRTIIADEKVELSEASLFAIARSAGGSMRDAQSLLEQVLSIGGENLSEESTTSLLGIVAVDSYIEIFTTIKDNDPGRLISVSQHIASTGLNVLRYIGGLQETLRALRFLKHDIEIDTILGYSKAETEKMKECALGFSDEELSAFFSILSDLNIKMKNGDNELIYFEMALFDMLAVTKTPSLAAILNKLETPDSGDKKKNRQLTPPAERSPTAPPAKTKLPIGAAWTEVLTRIAAEQKYLFEKIKLYIVTIDKNRVVLQQKTEARENGTALSSGDQDKISRMLLEHSEVKVSVIVHNSTEEEKPPLPAEGSSKELMEPPPGTKNEVHPTVAKIMDTFHGQIIKKGEK